MDNRILVLQLAECLGAIAVVMIASTSARFKPRPVKFLYPLREGVISFTLFATIMIFSYYYYYGNSPFINHQPGSIVITLQQRLFVAGVSLLPFIAALLIRRQPLLSIGWGKAMLSISGRLALLLAFMTLFLQGSFQTLFKGLTQQQIQAFTLIFGICLAEETIFHGYIQLRLSSWIGPRFGWLVAGLLLVIWQTPYLLISPFPFWPTLILIAVKGLLYGWIAQKGGHLLAPTVYRAVSEWIFILPYIH